MAGFIGGVTLSWSSGRVRDPCYHDRIRPRTCRGPHVEMRLLSRKKFDVGLKTGDGLHVALIGMSNCGKSYRSGQLELEFGFQRVSVDEEIEAAIEPELRALGFAGIEGMAEWMGYPYMETFAERERRYLELENDLTGKECEMLRIGGSESNFVLDTTGSVCYLSPHVHTSLKDKFLVIHLEASLSVVDQLVDNYFKMPKPVVWGDSYQAKPDEDLDHALRRCYPGLLEARLGKYRDLADVTVPASVSASLDITCSEFLDVVREQLI